MVIVGIVVTMFTLGIGVVGGTDREMSREIDRLESLLRLGLEDAEFQSRDLGLRFYPDGYEFSGSVFRIVENENVREWVPLTDEFFRARKIPPAFMLELEIGGRAVSLEKSREEVATRYQPQIFILSSGDMSDEFTVRLRERGDRLAYALDVAIDGSSEISRDEN